jgi:amino acid transporter
VVWIALVAVGHAELARSDAPLALVFERLTGLSPRSMSFIALIATLNGIIVQIIMSSRVLYGLARQGELPAVFSCVGKQTRTPVVATAVTTALVLAFALALPLHDLAEVTARLTLVVFAVVNVSLIRIKRRHLPSPPGIFEAPVWVPWAGAAACVVLLMLDAAMKLWA